MVFQYYFTYNCMYQIHKTKVVLWFCVYCLWGFCGWLFNVILFTHSSQCSISYLTIYTHSSQCSISYLTIYTHSSQCSISYLTIYTHSSQCSISYLTKAIVPYVLSCHRMVPKKAPFLLLLLLLPIRKSSPWSGGNEFPL